MQVARGYSLTKGDKAETRLQGLNGEQGGRAAERRAFKEGKLTITVF